MKKLFTVEQTAEKLGVSHDHLRNFIYFWGKDFPKPTMYGRGPLGRKVRFYTFADIGKIADFMDKYPMTPPLYPGVDRGIIGSKELITLSHLAMKIGVTPAGLTYLRNKGLLPNPVITTNCGSYYDKVVITRAVKLWIKGGTNALRRAKGAPAFGTVGGRHKGWKPRIVTTGQRTPA